MSELPSLEHEEELMRCWQESTIGIADPARLAREMGATVVRFDRKILWRNLAEYAAGMGLLMWSGYKALHGSTGAIAMMAGVSVMMGYLWWTHRGVQPIDPATSARSYRAAMLKRLDDQIRLLSRVKYWYLLPLYLPVLWMIIERWWVNPWRVLIGLVLMTSAFAFIGWLNESFGVRKLKETRARIAAFDAEEF